METVTESAEQSEKLVPKEPAKEIALRGDGTIAPATNTDAWRIAKVFLESGAMPKSFTNIAQVFMGMQFLREHNIPYVSGVRQLMIVHGTVSCWGELPLSIVRRSGKLDYLSEKIYTKEFTEICFANKNIEDVPYYAVCTLQRQDDHDPVERVFSMGDAKKAGLLDREKKTPWDTYPKRMLQMRARSWALKDSFPDYLSGIAIAEYDHNILPSAPEKIERPNVAKEINSELGLQ